MVKSREFQALLAACTQEGCPVCRLVLESTQRYLDAWKYEMYTDVAVREELRRTQGFCHEHTRQLVHMGAALALALAYRDVLSDSIEQLQQGEAAGKGFRRLFENKRERPPCPACVQKSEAEKHVIHTLRTSILDEEFYAQFAASQGLCLEHFRQASELKASTPAGKWLEALRSAQLICMQRLEQQLNEMIRKRDYRFKDEERGEEMLSWKRAAGLVAGEEEII